MAIAPCFDPTTGASGGAAPGGGTPPGLTVSGRADGGGYTVTAGARSLTISNPDGATLSTTVKKASDNSAVTVTGSTGTSPSWTAPAGGADGESVSVLVSATKDGLTTTVGFTERVVSTALASIALEAIDLTDGTWTLDDPTSMVKTTTHAAGINTITFNAKAATADYLMTSGANFTGARYYKLLSISGSQATTATPLVFVADVEPDVSASSTFNQKHYIGTTHNPTSTVVNTISGVGGGWQITNGSTTIQAGAWTRGATSFNSNATTERTFIASQRGFESLGAPAYMNIRSTDVVNNSNARASSQNAIGGAGANLYVAIFIGTSTGSSAIDDGDTAKFAASFVATSYGGI